MLLHGCGGTCREKVWGPDDEGDVCDLCGPSRFDEKGKPREFVVHFPLKQRFESLLKCAEYCKAARWETRRKRVNERFVTGTSALLIFPPQYLTSIFFRHIARCLRQPGLERCNGPPSHTQRQNCAD